MQRYLSYLASCASFLQLKDVTVVYDRLAEEEEETEREHVRVMAVMEREREERLDELDRQVFTVRQSRVHNFPIIMLI